MQLRTAEEAPAVQVTMPTGWQLAAIGFCTPGECLRRIDDGVAGDWLFLVRDDVTDFETAVRAAVADWLGASTWNGHGGPDWGDAIECVPAEVWLQRGLLLVTLDVKSSFLVDHSEPFPHPSNPMTSTTP
jgi:hypothetical protein